MFLSGTPPRRGADLINKRHLLQPQKKKNDRTPPEAPAPLPDRGALPGCRMMFGLAWPGKLIKRDRKRSPGGDRLSLLVRPVWTG
jgi:hypothetical protein